MRILSLDPATHCGWAHRDASSLVWGTWDLSVKRDESVGMKLLRLKAKLNEVRGLGIDLLVFEAARFAMPGMQGALVHQAQLQGVIVLWAIEEGLQYKGYSSTEIKKHATGKGNAKKDKMLASARERWGRVDDDNAADALWLLDAAWKELGDKAITTVSGAVVAVSQKDLLARDVALGACVAVASLVK